MNEVKQLWHARFNHFWKEAAGYLRYVFNSGFLVFLMFTFIAGGYYYSKLIIQIPSGFKLEWVIVPILTLFIVFGSIRTFLKEADLVYLLPMEWKMKAYFRHCFIYSYILKAFLLLFLIALLQPLYTHRFPEKSLLSVIVVVLLLSAFNLWLGWVEQRLHYRYERLFHLVFRMVMSFVLLFIFVTSGISLAFVFGMALFLLTIPYYLKLIKKSIHWLLLLEIEKRQLFRFYNTVNLFVDVPHLQNRIKERKLLPSITRWLPFEKSSTYLYFYLKTFSRSNELLDMIMRLTLFSGILILMASGSMFGQWIIIGVTLIMSSVQLSLLRKHHQFSIWLSLYPVYSERRTAAVIRIFLAVLANQAFVLSIIASLNRADVAMTFGATLLYSLIVAMVLTVIYRAKMKQKPSPF